MKPKIAFIVALMSLVSLTSFAQNTIKGVVKDSSGEILPGVVVSVQGSNTIVPVFKTGA